MRERVERAAALLLEARQSGQAVPIGAFGAELAGPDEAYAVQARVAAELGPIGAWKIGAPAPDAVPSFAPILAADLCASPATFAPGRWPVVVLECELAYRLACDVAPGETVPLERLIDAVLPALEIVASRIDGNLDALPYLKLADNQVNGALVVGPPTAGWQAHDPAAQVIELAIGGRIITRSTGGSAAGDPRRLVAALAAKASRHCGGLKAGQIVTTGALNGVHRIAPPCRIEARYPDLGSVIVEFG